MADKPPGGSSPGSPFHLSDPDEYTFNCLDGPYRCSDCGTSCRERITFNEHLVANHPRASLSHVCSHCGLEQADIEALRRHMMESQCTRNIHMCLRCPSWFREPRAMAWHLERHRERLLRRTCHKCSLLFTSRHKLREHRTSGHLREYECVVCGGKFIGRGYNALKNEQHTQKSPKGQKSPRSRQKDYVGLDGKTRRWVPLCSRCGKAVAIKLNLDQPNLEEMTAEELSRLLCNECGKGNCSKDEQENNEGLVQRLKEDALAQEEPKDDELPPRCMMCIDKFSQGEKRAHGDTEPDLVCDKCGKICRGGPEALSRHRKTCGEPVAGPSHGP